jgi:hypothetical protein
MKTKKEIEQLAESEYPIKRGGSEWMPTTNDIKKATKQEGFKKGYSQCQEDMAKEFEKDGAKLFKSEIRRAYIHGQGNGQMMGAGLERDEIDDYTNWRMRTLNKQD